MNTVVAVDDGLTPVRNYLSEQGCQVINIDQARSQRVDAVVLSGMDKDFLGIQDIMIDAPVFSAQGMSPVEVWQDIQEIIKQKQ